MKKQICLFFLPIFSYSLDLTETYQFNRFSSQSKWLSLSINRNDLWSKLSMPIIECRTNWYCWPTAYLWWTTNLCVDSTVGAGVHLSKYSGFDSWKTYSTWTILEWCRIDNSWWCIVQVVCKIIEIFEGIVWRLGERFYRFVFFFFSQTVLIMIWKIDYFSILYLLFVCVRARLHHHWIQIYMLKHGAKDMAISHRTALKLHGIWIGYWEFNVKLISSLFLSLFLGSGMCHTSNSMKLFPLKLPMITQNGVWAMRARIGSVSGI